ncbi:hypothetical protein LJC68_09650 [Bacteroidales bacterium OttesenSCG-928-B11]|nr:hypothetical protein [Bacteroidales bacterium OttesenSCG-928-B11]
MNNENFDREYTGLSEAMKNLNIMEGTIVTLNQSDRFQKDGFHIKMIPAADFFE